MIGKNNLVDKIDKIVKNVKIIAKKIDADEIDIINNLLFTVKIGVINSEFFPFGGFVASGIQFNNTTRFGKDKSFYIELKIIKLVRIICRNKISLGIHEEKKEKLKDWCDCVKENYPINDICNPKCINNYHMNNLLDPRPFIMSDELNVEGDVIGCGIRTRYENDQVFFTKNGKLVYWQKL